MAESKLSAQRQQDEESKERQRAYRKAYYARNREKILAKAKQQRIDGGDAVKAKDRAKRIKYRDKRNARNREYMRLARLADPDKFRAREKSYVAKNREKARERSARYYRRHKKKAQAATQRYWDKRKKIDPGFAISFRLRQRFRKALSAQNAPRAKRTMALIGCSICDFVKHIESQFLPGMSWSNRSLWHIDHIVPIAAFDLTDPEQQMAAFHYSNMRPLWAKENHRKGAKPPEPQHMFGFAYAARITSGVNKTNKCGRRRDGGRNGNN
jgi:hypothetical protein